MSDMTFEDLLRIYQSAVTAEAVRHDNPTESWLMLNQHLSWMLHNMPDRAIDTMKFQRCLGFVQALLMVTSVYTLDQLREQTRNVEMAEHPPKNPVS